MKSQRWRKGLIILAILVGVYFTLKHVGLYFVKSIFEREISQATKLNVHIGALQYSILGRSFSVREFKIQDRSKVLFHIHRVVASLKVSPFHPFTVPLSFQVDFPQKGYLDFSATYGIRTQAMDGKFQLKHYALVNIKDLFKDRFSLVPQDGIVDLNSDFQIRGSKLRSLHQIKIANFNYALLQGVKDIVGGALLGGPLGVTVGMLSSLTKKHEGNLAFSFRFDGDLADKKFNWGNVVSSAMSKAFQNALQGSKKSGTQPASELIEGISEILP